MNDIRGQLMILMAALAVLALGACSSDPIAVPTPPTAEEGLQLHASTPRADASGFSIDISWSAASENSIEAYEWAVGFSPGSDRYQPQSSLEWTRTTDDHVRLHFDDDASTQWVGSDPRARSFYVRGLDSDHSIVLATQELSFTPLSLAPEVHFVLPEIGPFNSCVSSGRKVALGWQASDADSKGLVPASVRYLVLPVSTASNDCLTRMEYEATDPIGTIATDDPRWSAWMPYDKNGDFRGAPGGVELDGLSVNSSYLVAIQARDADGATSRSFRWNREVRHFRVGVDKYPLLTITENNLFYSSSFVATSKTIVVDVVAGQPLRFFWSASASEYLGVIDAYRYGWDLSDVNDPNDPGWAVAWGSGPLWQQAPERSFSAGFHSFVVETRDNSGTVTRGVFEITVHAIPTSRRAVLLVDDVRDGGVVGEQSDAQQDAFWNNVLGSVLPVFDPNLDVIDAQSDAASLNLAKLLEYDAVIWNGNSSQESFLHIHFAPLSTSAAQWNWLEAYQAYGGNLLLVGAGIVGAGLPGPPPVFIEPIIFDDPSFGQLGFGVVDGIDGNPVNRGTLQWAYRSFCIESMGHVRPAFTLIFGERPGQPLRTTLCDATHTAFVDASFGAGAATIVDLVPTQDRLDLSPRIQLPFEEFYNSNPTSRMANLVERDCVKVMFRARTRRGAGLVSDELTCRPTGSTESSLEGVPIGIMSSARSATKPRVGSHDFLWGFNPLGFTEASIAPSLYWVFSQDWGLAATAP